MLLKLVICSSIYLVNICSVGNANEVDEFVQVHRSFLQELINNKDELVKVKQELDLKKQEEEKLFSLKQELQHLKTQLVNKAQHPEEAIYKQSETGTGVISELTDVGAELIRYGLRKKGKILVVLQAIKKFLMGRKPTLRLRRPSILELPGPVIPKM